jgi:macrodomain Ter protein organizer (MatP/YcbG family)
MQCIAEKSFLLSTVSVKNVADMAPHCDTMDGPVVKAAKRALEAGNVNYILPWVHKESEEELVRAFDQTLRVRRQTESNEAIELADLWFFETSVRLHREGEGAPYTGIKPAGSLESPAVPMADEAIETENADKVVDFLADAVKEELHRRFEHAISKKRFDENNVEAAREYVQAMLGFVLFAGHLHEYIESGGSHGIGAEGRAEHKPQAKEAAAASPVEA